MNKFEKLISDNGPEVLKRRANLINQSAVLAQQELINYLKTEKVKAQTKLDTMFDLAPENSQSLRPGTENWNAKDWVKSIQTIKQNIKSLDEQLEIAEDTFNEYFADSEVKDIKSKK